MTTTPDARSTEDELILEPPRPVSAVTPEKAAAAIRMDESTSHRIEAAVDAYVDALLQLETDSPEFQEKVSSISHMGNEEIRHSADASSRFLDRPMAALREGPLAEGSQVSRALVALREQVEALDPSRHIGRKGGLFRRAPVGKQVSDYFRRYQSAQTQIEKIVSGLYKGQDELLRDNAAIEQEKVHLWAMKARLEQYARMAAALDGALAKKIAELELRDPAKARALREDALFYLRQKQQDLLTQLSVTVQGYLALDLIRKNNQELVKGVERATTTTVSALRTAVISALALGNQRLVLDQINALNTTTGSILESTSEMLRQQSGEIQQQASSATVSVEKLQTAFNNIYATMATIDTFKSEAVESMRKTIEALSAEVSRAQVYVERAQLQDRAQSQAHELVDELTLPPSEEGA
jgi:uncharacterized protein YaaN involved in tellurite resistance